VDSAHELNKRKVRVFVEAVWNDGRLDLIDQLVATDYIGRVPGIEMDVHGPEGVHHLVSCGRRAHPDLYIKIDDQIAEDDRVATRWHATTETPVTGARPASTDRTACYTGISIIRLLAGKQVDSYTEYRNLAPSATFKSAKGADLSALRP
jgi:predicted SnoaL-like aldol condensation-catalyzing enzyme